MIATRNSRMLVVKLVQPFDRNLSRAMCLWREDVAKAELCADLATGSDLPNCELSQRCGVGDVGFAPID